MLSLLKITNFALIDHLEVEFEPGLNLLTGETGSGKSIIADALGVLIGGRFTSDMIKMGESRASVEGIFTVGRNPELESRLESAGIEFDGDLVVKRELASGGRNKIFINNQIATYALLRDLRPLLVDIHGQGDQQTLFDPGTHLDLLDAYAGLEARREEVAGLYKTVATLNQQLNELRRDEAEKLQLIDILRFQIDELERAGLVAGEDERLEEERRRLMNVERLSTLCAEAYSVIYDDPDSAIARLGQAARRVEELSQYDSTFKEHSKELATARALVEELAYALRDFSGGLEYSPSRLSEIEARLAELSRLRRKYGGSIDSALDHLQRSQDRLDGIERAEETEKDLLHELSRARDKYLKQALELHSARLRAVEGMERSARHDLSEVAMEHARFDIQVIFPSDSELAMSDGVESHFTSRGIDRVEFFFSANIGEPVRPLSKVASGGEASRLMLVLKTIANAAQFPRTIVFDEIDAGIGGRVAESVGLKLKKLAATHQVLCVTHQAQIARFAECHLLVRKEVVSGRTEVCVERLDKRGRVEEIARMLTGADITETARRHAREMLKTC